MIRTSQKTAPKNRLPARIERAIHREQDRSERVIGWVQMALVGLFGTLYALAPPPEGRMPEVADWMAPGGLPDPLVDLVATLGRQPVLSVLLCYFAATLIRLFWSYSARLPPWSLVGSILIDMGLLMGLIWSFHIQYGQPPAFYLKAPTLLYVFIFIALRAFRYEEIYVWTAGLVGAAGWMLLVAYAAQFDPSGLVPSTRSYVDFMYGPLILWGAEVDKVVTILLVSFLLGLVVRNARALLVRAVADQEAARDLKRFFSADVAEQITGSDEPVKLGQGRVCEGAVMFVDLRDFTSQSRSLAPDATVALLMEYQARIVPIIQRHGGSIDKFLGDGIMASFGCVRASPSYAADALGAVDAVMAEALDWYADRRAAGLPVVEVGAAIATGRVLLCAVGDETRLEYTLIGDAVNLAAKLEKHTKVAKVRALADAGTYLLARGQGYAAVRDRRFDGVTIDGLPDPIDLVVLA